jgi:peptide/nickel transport system substrate-binding protein
MREVSPRHRVRVAAAVGTAVVLGVSACTAGPAEPHRLGGLINTGGPTRASELTLAIAQDEGTLTPYTNVTGYPGKNLSLLVYDTLLRLDADNQIRPRLGLRADPSEDNRTFAVALRPDVTWHNGRLFTGEDVRFSVDYYKLHNRSDSSLDVTNIHGVTVEPGRVVFTLRTPDPEFPIRTLTDMRILPEHIWRSVTDPMAATAQQAIGTGPYRLTRYEKDRGYTLEANSDYPAGTPKVDRIQITIIPEQQAAVSAVRAGTVQMVSTSITGQAGKDLTDQGGVSVARGPDFASFVLLFNNGRSPFDRADVRAALARAIDRDELVRTVLLGEGTVGSPGFVHPQAPGADTELRPRFDSAEASRMLDATGARRGPDGIRVLDGKAMRYELLASAANPMRVHSAELIARMLRTVGVAITVTTLDQAAMAQRVWPDFDVGKGRDYDLAMWGWSAPVQYAASRVTALVCADTARGRLNVTGVQDADMDRLSREILNATTMRARTTASQRLQRLIAERMPFVTLFYPDGAYSYRKDTFDGWVYQKGAGILNTMSFVDFSG